MIFVTVLQAKTHTSIDEGFIPLAPARTDPIRLSIAGDGVWLEGRFDHWMSLTVEDTSEQGRAAQIIVDVTATADVDMQPNELFFFKARSTEQVGPLAFLARGTITRGEIDGEAEALIQTPAGHTPFVAVTFSFDRNRFLDVSERFSDLVSVSTQGTQLSPRAWLRPPVIASA